MAGLEAEFQVTTGPQEQAVVVAVIRLLPTIAQAPAPPSRLPLEPLGAEEVLEQTEPQAGIQLGLQAPLLLAADSPELRQQPRLLRAETVELALLLEAKVVMAHLEPLPQLAMARVQAVALVALMVLAALAETDLVQLLQHPLRVVVAVVMAAVLLAGTPRLVAEAQAEITSWGQAEAQAVLRGALEHLAVAAVAITAPGLAVRVVLELTS